MELKHKIILLAATPLAIAAIAIGLVVRYQAAALAAQQIAAVEPLYMSSKRAELKHYVDIAVTSIRQLYASGRDDPQTLANARAILNTLDYGDDGYFFVYDLVGNNLMHPRKPELVGRNLWDLRDPQGSPTIQRLLARAKAGGGFEKYLWDKPSTGHTVEKLGYVVLLERWGWMVGTGIYLDDVQQVMTQIDREVSTSIGHTMWVITSIAIASVLTVFLCGLALNISERKLADAKLKQLTQRIVTSQEEERARLARELHDGISQLLVSAKYTLESALERVQSGGPNPLEPFERGLTRLNEAIREVRHISHDLRPALLDHLGLPAALEHLGREFSERTGIATAVTAANAQADLPGAANTALFRIAQEALTNIERHAAASQVELILERRRRHLALAIRDNGRGFDVAGIEHSGGGIGLRNMRERLDHLGGRLALRSSPGRTEVLAWVPLSVKMPA